MGFDRSSADQDELTASINTTPLVDVMLVLLIIFLITIPVVTHTVPVDLPPDRNQPTQTRPDNVTLAVDRTGRLFWNDETLPDLTALQARLDRAAAQTPQPEIHIRGDRAVKYRAIGQVVQACQQAGIAKLAFITEPGQ